ncbi:MAG: carboxypeptidase-like regulatory domain-containing protein [Terriglobia bacterium]
MLANIAHRRRACIAGLVGVCLFVVLAPSLMAQGTGVLTGTVTDPTGAPVAFATVTTTSFDTGQVLPAATGPDGIFRFSLPPGNYHLTIESPGYKTVEIPAAKISVIKTDVQNCELEADEQTQSNPTPEPAQKPAPSPSNNPQEPSLEDLGITPAQAKGNPQTQALLDRRSHLLKVHQRLGLITIAPFAATLISSAFAGGRQTSSTDRDLHAALGATTVGFYIATAYFAIRAPKIPGTQTRGSIRLHKAMAWIHAPGMVLTPVLGEIAFAQKSRGERVHGIASLHGPVAIVTGAAFGLAVASVSIKF